MTEENSRDAQQDAGESEQVSQSQENISQFEPPRPTIRFENDSVELAESERDDT